MSGPQVKVRSRRGSKRAEDAARPKSTRPHPRAKNPMSHKQPQTLTQILSPETGVRIPVAVLRANNSGESKAPVLPGFFHS
jgi:hypothetical protein